MSERDREGRGIVVLALLLALPAFLALAYYEAHPGLMWTPENGRRADSIQAAIPRH